jgi:hypothetical protein
MFHVAPPPVAPTPPPPAALRRLREDTDALRPFLREWLIAAADAGYQAPAEDVPLLARLVESDPYARVPAARFAGPRGWHLAIAKPADPGDPTPDLFRTGHITGWVRYLRSLRAVAPERARGLLESEWWRPWSSEARRLHARERTKLLRTFEVNLSVADEPFLEAVLGGRIKRARFVAAHLLASLPGSAYGARMAQRAFACVELAGDRYELTPPAELDEAARRDKIGEGLKFPTVEGNTGPTSFDGAEQWLAEIIAATPLRAWEHRFQLTPQELVRRALDSDMLLLNAWMFAATRQRDTAWALAVAATEFAARGLLAIAHPEDVDRWFTTTEQRGYGFSEMRLIPGPWEEATGKSIWSTAQVLMGYGRAFAADDVAAMARCLPVPFVRLVRDHLTGLDNTNPTAAQVAEILTGLEYRVTMLAELTSRQ